MKTDMRRWVGISLWKRDNFLVSYGEAVLKINVVSQGLAAGGADLPRKEIKSFSIKVTVA